MSLVAAYGSSDESGESDSEQIDIKERVPESRTETSANDTDITVTENHVSDKISDGESDSENSHDSEQQQTDSKSVDSLLKGYILGHLLNRFH